MEVQKKPIIGELRKLNVGGVATFPIEQRSSVIASISKLKKELMRQHWDAVRTDRLSEYKVDVTRIH
jgi:hypothetical protein